MLCLDLISNCSNYLKSNELKLLNKEIYEQIYYEEYGMGWSPRMLVSLRSANKLALK